MPTYTKAKAQVEKLVDRIMKQFHAELHDAGVTVSTLMVGPTTDENGNSSGPPLKIKGYPCVAIIKLNSTRDRAEGKADVTLQLDEDRWKEATDDEKAAIVDHELEHLVLKKDKDGATVYDDQNRPRLRMKPHDREVGWFDAVVRRHSEVALEFKQFQSVWNQCKQLSLPFMEAVG